MDPHAVVALRIIGQENGNTISNLHPVFTLQNGETRDRSVQYQKGWRVESVNSSSGPAIMWEGYYGPGNHHVVAFIKPNDPNETYREDHYTNKGVLDHKDPFRCRPTGTQPTVAHNAPVPSNEQVAHNRGDQPNPNAEQRQASQSRTAGAEPPEQYSIVEVAHDSKGCRPAYSDNCITLKKGERVVVEAWMITTKENPRRGQYCLRPLAMAECYWADLTAIEIDGKPMPVIGSDKPAEKPITPDDCKPLPQGIEGMKTTTMGQLQRHQQCIAMDGGDELSQLYQKWVYVSVCNQSREGYLVQWVNDADLERAHRGLKGAESRLIEKNPSLDERKDQIWQTALNRRVTVIPELCKRTAIELSNASPEGHIVVPRP
jgi:hypothetical protein